jgi:hypothetical protein
MVMTDVHRLIADLWRRDDCGVEEPAAPSVSAIRNFGKIRACV